MTQQEVIERAWSRIKRSPWDKAFWFVRLLNTDLSTLSAGDQLNWQEEFQALASERTAGVTQPPPRNAKGYPIPSGNWGAPDPPTPTLKEMLDVQSAIKPILEALADGKDVATKELRFLYYVDFRKTTEAQERAGAPRYWRYRMEMPLRTDAGYYLDEVPLILTRLMEQSADKIRRCRHCKKVFLQIQSNARYCGRSCHSIAGTRISRGQPIG